MKQSSLGNPRRSVTANYHFIRSCNYRCKYCYATFCDSDQHGDRVSVHDIHAVTRLLARGFTKITFVGGEPTLYHGLSDLLSVAKSEGALTNVVTNGSVLTHDWLMANRTKLDFLTLSIDSGIHATLSAIGRVTTKGESLPPERFVSLAVAAKAAGIAVKVNTVVTRLNQPEDLSSLILRIAPERWKILQAAPVEGQNDRFIGDLTPSPSDFESYWQRAKKSLDGSGIRVIPEPVDTIRGSYVMVDPCGRFFDSTTGTHHYSSPILTVGLDKALSEISFNEAKFRARGGTVDFENREPLQQVRITLGGVAGSGKSTVAKILSERTGAPFASVGKFAREVAEREYGVSINEFQKLSADNPELDARIDAYIQEWCDKRKSFIADYRLGFKFVRNSFRVLLTVTDPVATARIQSANRKGENTNTAQIYDRNERMRVRFQETYGVDFTDPKHYDLIVPTDALTPSEIADMILVAASR